MTRILYIILISISVSSCSQKFRSTELKDNFSGAEIKDLQQLTSFFQSQMCGSTDEFSSCIDSLIPYLGEYGYIPILENVDFEEQKELYSNFESDLFSQIWDFGKARNMRDNKTYKSIRLNTEGKYSLFLKDLSKRNSDLEQYYESIMGAGDWESMGLLQQRIYTNPEHYNLKDPSIQVLIAVHYLTQNDEQKRKEPWTEN